MNIYWSIMFFEVIAGIIVAAVRKPGTLYYIIVATTITVFAGLRYKTGYDYDAYVEMFYSINSNFPPESIEIGWLTINKVVYWFGGDSQAVFFVSSLFVYGLIFWALHREVGPSLWAILAFLIGIDFFWGSVAIIRQYMAIALFLVAVTYYLNNDRVRFFAFNTLALAFHTTAIIGFLVPVLAAVDVGVMVVGLLAATVLGSQYSLTDLVNIEAFKKYEDYVNGSYLNSAGGLNSGLVLYLRLLVAAALVYTVYTIDSAQHKKFATVSRLLIFGYFLYYIFSDSEAVRRAAYYYTCMELVVIGYITNNIKTTRSALMRTVSIITITGYYMFYTLVLFKDVIWNPGGESSVSLYNYRFMTIFDAM